MNCQAISNYVVDLLFLLNKMSLAILRSRRVNNFKNVKSSLRCIFLTFVIMSFKDVFLIFV